jgi:hypothetical protein
MPHCPERPRLTQKRFYYSTRPVSSVAYGLTLAPAPHFKI